MPKNAPPIQVIELIWSRDGTGFLLNLIPAEDLHDTWSPRIEQTVGTFEYVGE